MPNIFITGFMGVGKTTISRHLAELAHRRLVVLDDELVKSFNCSIADFFTMHGEQEFRRREADLLKKIASEDNLVVDTGGGVPTIPPNREIMHAHGAIVWLDVPFDIIAKRMEAVSASTSRPNWQSRDQAYAKYLERLPAYQDCDYRIPATGEAHDISLEILSLIEPQTDFQAVIDGKTLTVTPDFAPEQKLAHFLQERQEAGKHYSNIVIITDENIAALHLERYHQALPSAIQLVIKPGEESKTLNQAGIVYQQLLDLHIGRDALIVAVGGGAVTDFAAFVAATYKRGIDFILVSTTLLGCVDAVIGGKTAVNIGPYKNQVGLFALPQRIFLDLQALSSLPESQIREGLVEAYKTGLVCKQSLADYIANHRQLLMSQDIGALSQTAVMSAKAKAEVVRQDFREQGLRKILNLGHTFGHAVEAWSAERFSHGLCVAQGLIVALRLAANRKYVDTCWAESHIEIVKYLRGNDFSLPTAKLALPFMLADKKNTDSKITFILPHREKGFILVQDITEQELQKALQ